MIFFSSPYLIPNPTRSFDHNWDFPKAFWKESRPLLIAAVLSLTAAEVARPFAVYHMESNTSLFMASPDDTTVQRDWKPSSIYQLYGHRCESTEELGPASLRPKIIVHIYLKVVGLKERKAGLIPVIPIPRCGRGNFLSMENLIILVYSFLVLNSPTFT